MSVSIADVPGISVGHAEVADGGSGCTVLLGPFRARVDERGLATGARELDVLRGDHIVPRADALLFTGGSAFGLAAADGVMGWLEARGRGHPTRTGPVPIVPAAVLYDLAPGRGRPGPAEGHRACESAGTSPPEGRVGAGAGATVRKLHGLEHAVPGGVGTYALEHEGWVVGALAAVNAVGEVGLDLPTAPEASPTSPGNPLRPGEHTTLAAVATNAPLEGDDLTRLTRLASTALARCINPVHTPFDGDLTFGLSTSDLAEPVAPEKVMALGLVARDALEQAILRAVVPVDSG